MTKPIIGISCDIDNSKEDKPRIYLNNAYFDSVIAAGGIPLLLPFSHDRAIIEPLIERVDGLLLTGGGDVDPALYAQEKHELTKVAGERRMRTDYLLAQIAIKSDLPVMGVCLGMQILNVVAGGTLCQDLKTFRPGVLEHQQPEKGTCEAHKVTVSPGSFLASIVGDEVLGVNSTHHQAIETVAPCFNVVAKSTEDDVIEAIEMPGAPRIFAVQWHPERLSGHAARHLNLFKALVRLASSRGAKKLNGLVTTTCDT